MLGATDFQNVGSDAYTNYESQDDLLKAASLRFHITTNLHGLTLDELAAVDFFLKKVYEGRTQHQDLG